MPCLHKDAISPGSAVTKVVDYINTGTHRETVEEYAESHDKSPDLVKANTAATGRLICGKDTSSANLVVKGDIIVGVAHALVDPDTCQKSHSATDCKFQVDGAKPIRIKELVASGTECPPKKKNSDWLIMRLEKPVSNVKPYRVAPRPLDLIDPNKRITIVGALSVDFQRPNTKTGKMENPKHIQDCTIQRLIYVAHPLEFGSDCSGSLGKSGGAVLSGPIEDPLFVGISVGNVGAEEDFKTELRTKKPVQREFNRKTAFDGGVALHADFYTALQVATK